MAMMHRDQFNRFLFDSVALFIPTSLCDTSEHCVCYLIGRGSIRACHCDLWAPDDSDENLLTSKTFLLLLLAAQTQSCIYGFGSLSELLCSRRDTCRGFF